MEAVKARSASLSLFGVCTPAHHPSVARFKRRRLSICSDQVQRHHPPRALPKKGPAPEGAQPPEDSWRVFGVSVPAADDPGKDDYSVHPALLKALEKKLGCRKPGALPPHAFRLVRKSFDARKSAKSWVYVVDVPAAAAAAAGARLQERSGHLELLTAAAVAAGGATGGPARPPGHRPPGPLPPRPLDRPAPRGGAPVVVVGSGPAGLFAALAMAEAGVECVLLERGQPVEVRGRDIGALFVRRRANPESNVCFGEGGAGTWSDGKLTTRIGRNSDPVQRVLRTLRGFGAPEHILLAGKPHLGTDRLVRILRAFRAHLVALGVDVRFGARAAGLRVSGGRVAGVGLEGGDLAASAVVLAVGHSARDVYADLAQLGVALTPKPFAMGFRIEHPQALIDRIQYGERDGAAGVLRGKGPLPVAEYRLATEVSTEEGDQGWESPDAWYAPLYADAGGGDASPAPSAGSTSAPAGLHSRPPRGVYSFCMCPGGQIVPTGTSPDELCLNGMSFSRRNSRWANAALVASVGPGDWAHHLPGRGALAGVQLQRDIEREAARRGGGGFAAPVQLAADFMAGRTSSGPLPSSSYRLGVRSAPLHDLYPPHMTTAFRAALLRFERQMPGFLGGEALLHAAETRTSAAVRVERDAGSLQSPSLRGLYPCGEGAGYAGGIVSAAVDGLRVGRAVVAELTGRSDAADDAAAAAYTVKGGY